MKWLNVSRINVVTLGLIVGFLAGGRTVWADFTFGEPVSLGPTVNSPGYDYFACPSADGLELFFVSDRPGGSGAEDLWVSTRTTRTEPWREPVNLGPLVNTPYTDSAPCLSADGLELYFSGYCPDGYYIRMTTRPTTHDAWGEPVNLGDLLYIDSETMVLCPSLSGDGLELYVSIGHAEPVPEWSIAVARRASKDAPWEAPVSLGSEINSWCCQGHQGISSDGLLLVFSDIYTCSPRPDGFGGTDIWFTRRATKDGEWGTPMNLWAPVSSAFYDDHAKISADGSTLYWTSQRPGGQGAWDLWQAPTLPIVDFNGDGRVDDGDVDVLNSCMGTDDPKCDIGPMPWGDGVVDEADLEVLMGYWGQDVDYPYDPKRASGPKPRDNSILDVEQAVSIHWLSGRYSAQHDVYIGMDPVAVQDADISDTTGIYRGRQEACEYTLSEDVLSNQTFYWRIDEFGTDTSVIKGQVWNFSVADYLIVDDMESSEQVWQRWWDGYGDPNNGSVADDEFAMVHSGEKSMFVLYDNSETPISRMDRFWETPQDWTRKGVETLTLWLHGNPDNSSEPLCICLGDSANNASIVAHPDPAVLLSDTWQEWSIVLADIAGVNLAEINSMAIVIGDDATGEYGTGTVYIDDIYLRPVSAQGQ